MDCAACKEPMIVLELDKIEIDYCLECGSIWLDAGELELLFDDPSQVVELMEHPGTIKSARPGKRKCPICLKKMDEIEVGSQPMVTIDRCPNKHGLWFDRGELKDVINNLEGAENGKIGKLLKEMFRE